MDESNRRLGALGERMKEAGADLVALPPGPDMRYFLGWHPHLDERTSFLVATPNNARLLMPALNADEARAHTPLPLSTYADEDGPHTALAALLAALGAGGARRVLVGEACRFDFVQALGRALPEAALDTATGVVAPLRMRKDAQEVALLDQNAHAADAAVQEAFRHLEAGITELELEDLIARAFAEAGSAFDTAIVGFGENAAFPHHRSGTRRLEVGDAVVVDTGGEIGGYHSDITRMGFLGEPTAAYREIHATVDAALRAALAAAHPGAHAKDVDDAARSVIRKAGHGDHFTHRIGHGLGLEIHERPFMTASNDLVLEEGMTFSIEPGIYLPGQFGVRLEEIVVLEAGGPRILSGLDRQVFPHRV